MKKILAILTGDKGGFSDEDEPLPGSVGLFADKDETRLFYNNHILLNLLLMVLELIHLLLNHSTD